MFKLAYDIPEVAPEWHVANIKGLITVVGDVPDWLIEGLDLHYGKELSNE